jgi:hypothetical protein
MTHAALAHNRLVYAKAQPYTRSVGWQADGYYLLVRCIPYRDGVQIVSGALRQFGPLPLTDGTSLPLFQADGQPREYWVDKGKLLDGKEALCMPHDADPGVAEAERISIPEAARELNLSVDRVRKILADTHRTLTAYHRMQPDWQGLQPHGILRYFVEGNRYYTTRAWLESYKRRREIRSMNAVERASLRERGAAARRTVQAAAECIAQRLRAEDLYVGGSYTDIYPGPLLELVECGPQAWEPGGEREALRYLADLLEVITPLEARGAYSS